MGLYIGGKKINVYSNQIKYKLNIYSPIPIVNGNLLLSSDGYILNDVNGLYITAAILSKLLSSDSYVLKDSREVYLMAKEE